MKKTNKKIDDSKCPHGVRWGSFCTACTYGVSARKIGRTRDVVEELNMPIGYKLHRWDKESA